MSLSLRFALLAAVSHGVSTRHGGVSPPPYDELNFGYSTDDAPENVRSNRRRYLEREGIPPERVISGWLTHGSDVAVFRAGRESEWPIVRDTVGRGAQYREPLFRADAVVSDVPSLHFLLTFADCVPLLFADPVRGIVGAAHAGWRGTAQAIGQAVVRAMWGEFGSDPRDIVVGIGPSIGPCCYTVSREVPAAFAARGVDAAVLRRGDALVLDLWESNERQLRDAGVPPASVENLRLCTGCHTDDYFSHRAEGGKTGRFGASIGLT